VPLHGRSELARFAFAPVEPFLEAAAEFFARAQDREVARSSRWQADQLDVVATIAVAARVRLRFLKRADSPPPVPDVQESQDVSGL
jgi:hypothetical protein